ncbi:imelysin family protein [Cognatiyoonia sp. IB215182]|uniref:imelysin family protein n=1 Tax=Cognatiyoonia sp. IB215182 TaxID=3097353 RepID=UPI002A1040E6|nr:imelysin family protein [Cognatiyoonia sp. IB215182]MDX8352550.1 imelysin family protein [Cognatiyoonia sp. IB215182]
MKPILSVLAILGTTCMATAQTEDIVNDHILPGMAALAETGAALSDAAQADCSVTSMSLRDAYHAAFDAWIMVSHLRFGPSEVDDRAFALAFWPDSRGATPRSLAALIRDEDPIAESVAAYAEMSVASRGFYAMEFVLFDETISAPGNPTYRCQLVQTIAGDIAATTAAIHDGWVADYAAQMTNPSDIYQDDREVLQELFKALNTGLQFTSESRLGRPLGTFDAPRPQRAEAWRAGRSARHVTLSLTSLRDLGALLSGEDEALLAAFDVALARLQELDDPAFAGVATPQNRLEIEIIQQKIEEIRTIVLQDIGPTLGVSTGFNALDGD